jgi:hypothetical protein
MVKSDFGVPAFDRSNLAGALAGGPALTAPLAGTAADGFEVARNKLAAVGLSSPIPRIEPAIVAPFVDPNWAAPSLLAPIGGGCGGKPAAMRWRGASGRSGLDG